MTQNEVPKAMADDEEYLPMPVTKISEVGLYQSNWYWLPALSPLSPTSETSFEITPPPSVFATLPDLVFSLNFISVPFAFLSWSPRQEAGAKREGTELETGIFLLTVSKEVRQGRRPGCLGCSSTVCSRLTWFEWSLTACQTQK